MLLRGYMNWNPHSRSNESERLRLRTRHPSRKVLVSVCGSWRRLFRKNGKAVRNRQRV